DRLWFSTNGVLDAQSQGLGDFPANQDIPAGDSYWRTNTVTLPMSASGNYALFVQADIYNQIPESNEGNNTSAPVFGTFDLRAPDLAPVGFGVSSNNVVLYPTSPQSPTVTASWAVTDQGTGAAASPYGYWFDTVYVSTNTSISGA